MCVWCVCVYVSVCVCVSLSLSLSLFPSLCLFVQQLANEVGEAVLCDIDTFHGPTLIILRADTMFFVCNSFVETQHFVRVLVYIYVYTSIYIYIYTDRWINQSIDRHMYRYINIYVNMCVHAHILSICIYIYAYMCVQTLELLDRRGLQPRRAASLQWF